MYDRIMYHQDLKDEISDDEFYKLTAEHKRYYVRRPVTDPLADERPKGFSESLNPYPDYSGLYNTPDPEPQPTHEVEFGGGSFSGAGAGASWNDDSSDSSSDSSSFDSGGDSGGDGGGGD